MASGSRGAKLAVRGLLVLSVVGLLAAIFSPDTSVLDEPDVLEAGWYRSAHCRALLKLPALDPDWSIKNPRPGRIVFQWLKQIVVGEITLVVQAPEEFSKSKDEGAALAERLATTGAASIKQSLQFLAETAGRRFEHADGVAGFEIDLDGMMGSREPLEQRVYVLAQGKQVASLVTVARGDCVPEVAAVASRMVASLKIGSQVPRLAPRNLDTPLQGVYVSSVENGERSWRVFDPRGYVSDRPPTTARMVDLEALYQTSESPPIATYEIKNGMLEVQRLSPGSETLKTKLSVSSGKLDLGGREFVRVDGFQGSLELSGRYRMREAPGAVLTFSPGGSFKREEGSSTSAGSYLIVGGRIRFAWQGHTEVKTLFRLGDVIFVGAVEYLLER